MRVPLPVLMWPEEILNLKQAVYRSKLSERQIRRLCKEFGIGRRSATGGPLQISMTALEMVLSDDLVALELLREGHRDAPEVMRYLRSLQLAP
jgi:hypothetical protein